MNRIKLICPSCSTEADLPKEFVDEELQQWINKGGSVKDFVLCCPNCRVLEQKYQELKIKAEEMEVRLKEVIYKGDWTSIAEMCLSRRMDIEISTHGHGNGAFLVWLMPIGEKKMIHYFYIWV